MPKADQALAIVHELFHTEAGLLKDLDYFRARKMTSFWVKKIAPT